jgi:hypothetical protein
VAGGLRGSAGGSVKEKMGVCEGKELEDGEAKAGKTAVKLWWSQWVRTRVFHQDSPEAYVSLKTV